MLPVPSPIKEPVVPEKTSFIRNGAKDVSETGTKSKKAPSVKKNSASLAKKELSKDAPVVTGKRKRGKGSSRAVPTIVEEEEDDDELGDKEADPHFSPSMQKTKPIVTSKRARNKFQPNADKVGTVDEAVVREVGRNGVERRMTKKSPAVALPRKKMKRRISLHDDDDEIISAANTLVKTTLKPTSRGRGKAKVKKKPNISSADEGDVSDDILSLPTTIQQPRRQTRAKKASVESNKLSDPSKSIGSKGSKPQKSGKIKPQRQYTNKLHGVGEGELIHNIKKVSEDDVAVSEKENSLLDSRSKSKQTEKLKKSVLPPLSSLKKSLSPAKEGPMRQPLRRKKESVINKKAEKKSTVDGATKAPTKVRQGSKSGEASEMDRALHAIAPTHDSATVSTSSPRPVISNVTNRDHGSPEGHAPLADENQCVDIKGFSSQAAPSEKTLITIDAAETNGMPQKDTEKKVGITDGTERIGAECKGSEKGAKEIPEPKDITNIDEVLAIMNDVRAVIVKGRLKAQESGTKKEHSQKR